MPLSLPDNVGTPLLWGVFALTVPLLLAIDLWAVGSKEGHVSYAKATLWTAIWVSVAAAYGGLIYWQVDSETALEFASGYLLEQSLSVDNVFVFIVIFHAFAVPKSLHHRVLFWGVAGAFVLRGIFVVAGTTLIHAFHGVMYFFGALLVYTGIKLGFQKDDPVNPTDSFAVKLFRKFIPTTAEYRGSAFFVRDAGTRTLMATPLFLVLVVVETSDVVFAVDSVPAVFAVTQDPFVVYTSNIFAILGLRSLYFLVSGMMSRFRYLKVGLSVVLLFVGVKILIADYFHIPTPWSLGVLALIIGGSVLASMLITAPDAPHDDKPGADKAVGPSRFSSGDADA